MADIVLFHHVLGLTDGVLALADSWRAGGHTVHTPDLFDGRTFSGIDEGLAHVRTLGFDTVIGAGAAAAQELPTGLVYAGVSLGVLPAQYLAQTREGSRGALFLEACVPVSEFGDRWPAQLPVQVHGMADDPSFAGEGDLEAARDLVAQARHGELFLYPGDAHLFTDSGLASHDPQATALLTQRVLAFLDTTA